MNIYINIPLPPLHKMTLVLTLLHCHYNHLKLQLRSWTCQMPCDGCVHVCVRVWLLLCVCGCVWVCGCMVPPVVITGPITAFMPITHRWSDKLPSYFVPCVLSEVQQFSARKSKNLGNLRSSLNTSCKLPHALSLLECSFSCFLERPK